MSGAHSCWHVACLVAHMPQGSALAESYDEDNGWTREEVLLSMISNTLSGMVYGMSDPAKRGRQPSRVGPSYLKNNSETSVTARSLPVAKLLEELNKPRGAANG